MSSGYLRYLANAIVTVFCLGIIIVKLNSISLSAYHLLWSGVAILIPSMDIYFLTKSSLNAPQNMDTSPSSFFISVGASLGLAASAVVINYPVTTYFFTDFLRQIGLIAALIPYPFIIWSLLCLKACLTVIPEAHSVVAHGIYKFSRHPLYMCYSIWNIANIMMFPTWPMLTVALTNIALLVLRIKREEKLLLATFPEYRDYYRRTGLVGNIRLNFLFGKHDIKDVN